MENSKEISSSLRRTWRESRRAAVVMAHTCAKRIKKRRAGASTMRSNDLDSSVLTRELCSLFVLGHPLERTRSLVRSD